VQWSWRAFSIWALVLVGIGVGLGRCSLEASFQWAAPGMLGATVLVVAGFCCSIVALVLMKRAQDGIGDLEVALVVVSMLLSGFLSLVGAGLTFFLVVGSAHGRQLRRRGKVLLPPVEPGAGWARLQLAAFAPAQLRTPLAAWWRETGRSEHASVAAFSRLTLELLALGAPAELVEAANRDASDEIRHADQCFSIAQALDGRSERPGPFPRARDAGRLPSPRPLALAGLAVSSLVDGALNEGLSARVLARLADRCQEPAIREALRLLAADEGRHAADAWKVIEWCLAEGRAPVAHALRSALCALPEHLESGLPAKARSGAWEGYGVQGASLEAEEHGKARADVLHRAHALIDERLAA